MRTMIKPTIIKTTMVMAPHTDPDAPRLCRHHGIYRVYCFKSPVEKSPVEKKKES
jgi:hypothetical protein